MKQAMVLLLGFWLSTVALANPMRFGHTTSPAAFRIDLPGSWLRSKVAGCYEDLSGARIQAIISENAERTVANTYPDWKKRFTGMGYQVKEVDFNGSPGLLARGPHTCMGVVLHAGHQINLMINLSGDNAPLEELLEQLVISFQWLNP